jgi:hypothetical protein
MHSLHDVPDMDTYRADRVCLSVGMIQLDNQRKDLNKIWFGCYARVFPKIVLFNVLQSAVREYYEVGSTPAPFRYSATQ